MSSYEIKHLCWEKNILMMHDLIIETKNKENIKNFKKVGNLNVIT
jgi:hypothetical protein